MVILSLTPAEFNAISQKVGRVPAKSTRQQDGRRKRRFERAVGAVCGENVARKLVSLPEVRVQVTDRTPDFKRWSDDDESDLPTPGAPGVESGDDGERVTMAEMRDLWLDGYVYEPEQTAEAERLYGDITGSRTIDFANLPLNLIEPPKPDDSTEQKIQSRWGRMRKELTSLRNLAESARQVTEARDGEMFDMAIYELRNRLKIFDALDDLSSEMAEPASVEQGQE